jgi:hypothetical protein
MTDGWREGPDRPIGDRGPLALGLVLMLVGAAFLLTEQLHFDWARQGWPVFIIVPGLVLLIVGLAIPNDAGLGAAIPGAIVTTVGLVLASQEATDSYETWSYAWALVAPGSVGVALTLYGLLHRRPEHFDSGLKTAGVGLALFVSFGLFFEVVLNLGDRSGSLMRDILPYLAIGVGVVIVLLNVLPRPRCQGSVDSWSGPAGGDGTGEPPAE